MSWIAGDDDVGRELADDARHRASRIHIGNKITVRATQKMDIFRTDDFRRILLLFLAHMAEIIPRGIWVAAAFFPTS